MEGTGLSRLFPDTPGYNEDNGTLLEQILRALPADRLQTAAAAIKGLTRATAGITPEDCGLPHISYEDALGAGHIPALRRYWSNPEYAARLFATPITTKTPNLDDGYDFATTTIIQLINHGHFEALQLSRTRGCPWDVDVCTIAAKHGRLDILRWVRAQDPPCPWNEQACELAASYGHLEILQWLRSQEPPCPWRDFTDYSAAAHGQLACLQWAHTNGCPSAEKHTCEIAAQNGNLEILQWVRAQDPPYPWTSSACTRAAEEGHLGVLQWLRTQNPPCPWDKYTYDAALYSGHDKVAQWVRDNGCPRY